MLADLTTNKFPFQGVPEIQVSHSGKAFEVTFQVSDAVAGPFILDEKAGTAEARHFEEGDPVSGTFSKTVQT